MARDPICGKEVDPLRARAVGIFGGRTWYFCSPEHKAEFARDPGAQVSGRVATPGPSPDPTIELGAEEVDALTADSRSPAAADAPTEGGASGRRTWLYVVAVAAAAAIAIVLLSLRHS